MHARDGVRREIALLRSHQTAALAAARRHVTNEACAPRCAAVRARAPLFFNDQLGNPGKSSRTARDAVRAEHRASCSSLQYGKIDVCTQWNDHQKEHHAHGSNGYLARRLSSVFFFSATAARVADAREKVAHPAPRAGASPQGCGAWGCSLEPHAPPQSPLQIPKIPCSGGEGAVPTLGDGAALPGRPLGVQRRAARAMFAGSLAAHRVHDVLELARLSTAPRARAALRPYAAL